MEAYRALERLDPVSAERLHPTDTTRIQRALEVIRSTGKPLDQWHKQKTGGIADKIRLHPLVLLPPREWLYRRCDLRLHQMIEGGARKEVDAKRQYTWFRNQSPPEWPRLEQTLPNDFDAIIDIILRD